MRPKPLRTLVTLVLTMLSVQLIVPVILLRLLPGSISGETTFFITIAALELLFVVPVVIHYTHYPDEKASLRLKGLDPVTGVLTVLAAVIGVVALSQLTAVIGVVLRTIGIRPPPSDIPIPGGGGGLLILVVVVGILPALTEEPLFRGLLLPALERLGRWPAALLSGLVFALMHGQIDALPAQFLLGTVLALLAIDTGSLLAPVLMHAAHNSVIVGISAATLQSGAQAAPQAPTLAQVLPQVPLTLALLGVYGLFVLTALRRGRKRRAEDALPGAVRAPLGRGAWALLMALIAALLILTIAGGSVT